MAYYALPDGIFPQGFSFGVFCGVAKRKTDAALASALAKMRRIELDPAHFLLEVDITDYFKQIA